MFSKTKKAQTLEVKEDFKDPMLQFKLEDDTIIYEIPIRNILDTEIINLRKYRKIDKLIQIIFMEDKQRLRIIRLNVQDNQIECLNHKIQELIIKMTAYKP
jgi:hypothetical protein